MAKKRSASRNGMNIMKCDKNLLDNVEKLIAAKKCNKQQLRNLEVLRDVIMENCLYLLFNIAFLEKRSFNGRFFL